MHLDFHIERSEISKEKDIETDSLDFSCSLEVTRLHLTLNTEHLTLSK